MEGLKPNKVGYGIRFTVHYFMDLKNFLKNFAGCTCYLVLPPKKLVPGTKHGAPFRVKKEWNTLLKAILKLLLENFNRIEIEMSSLYNSNTYYVMI
jgi:hypothetical protein